MENEILPFKQYTHLVEEKIKKDLKNFEDPYDSSAPFLKPKIKKIDCLDYYNKETG